MARRFAGGTDAINLSLGALGFAMGPGTIAAVARVNSSDIDLFCAGSGVDWALFVEGVSTKLSLWTGTTSNTATVLCPTTDGWVLLAATKASGSSTPRFYKYVYATDTWQIATASVAVAASAVADSSASIGQDVGGGSNWNGDIAAIAAWNVVLTDDQIASLVTDVSIANWSASTRPKGMWIPGPTPAVTVVDLTGNGANESSHSGTSATPDEFPLLAPSARRRAAPVGVIR